MNAVACYANLFAGILAFAMAIYTATNGQLSWTLWFGILAGINGMMSMLYARRMRS